MKDKKSKIIGVIGGVGALCVLCCSLPVLGLLGLGAIEAFFCENELLQGMGITLVAGSLIYFGAKFYKRSKASANSCEIDCGCKAN